MFMSIPPPFVSAVSGKIHCKAERRNISPATIISTLKPIKTMPIQK
jgi:hypothetical protein